MDTYIKEASTFLSNTKTTFLAILSPNQTCPNWGECKPTSLNKIMERKYTKLGYLVDKDIPHNHGLKYDITFTREGKTLSFPFWASLVDSYSRGLHGPRKAPTSYDVLACISGDVFAHEQTFDEFCDNFGYSNDSIKALSIYREVCELSIKISRFWDDKELEELQEIC